MYYHISNIQMTSQLLSNFTELLAELGTLLILQVLTISVETLIDG